MSRKVFLFFTLFGSSWMFVESIRRALSTDSVSCGFGGLRGSSRILQIPQLIDLYVSILVPLYQSSRRYDAAISSLEHVLDIYFKHISWDVSRPSAVMHHSPPLNLESLVYERDPRLMGIPESYTRAYIPPDSHIYACILSFV